MYRGFIWLAYLVCVCVCVCVCARARAITSGGDTVIGVAKILIFRTQQILNSLVKKKKPLSNLIFLNS